MTELTKRLIAIYAAGTVEAVHGGDDYQRLCAERVGDAIFDRERKRVEELRRQAEAYLAGRASYRQQVEFALRLLRKLKTDADQEICRELILKAFAPRWEAAQREFYSVQSLRLVLARHYFLSFTTRNPGKPNINHVNRNHQFFITDTLGHETYERADKAGQNLLAEAVHHLLRQKWDGFFFPSHEEDNQVVEQKLRENCVRALAFVQLAQGEMFRTYEGRRNWCHFEYTLAKGAAADHVLFVKIDDEVLAAEIEPNFEPWLQAYEAQDPVRLEATRWHDPATIDNNFKRIKVKLTEQIQRCVDRVYLEIPG